MIANTSVTPLNFKFTSTWKPMGKLIDHFGRTGHYYIEQYFCHHFFSWVIKFGCSIVLNPLKWEDQNIFIQYQYPLSTNKKEMQTNLSLFSLSESFPSLAAKWASKAAIGSILKRSSRVNQKPATKSLKQKLQTENNMKYC